MLSFQNLPLTRNELLLSRQEFNKNGYTELFNNQPFLESIAERVLDYERVVYDYLSEKTNFNHALKVIITERFTVCRFDIVANSKIDSNFECFLDDNSYTMQPNDFFALAEIFSESEIFQQLIADTALFTVANFVTFLFETRVEILDAMYQQRFNYLIIDDELETLKYNEL